jgi:SSS family solute:Na+ symporter
MIIALIIVIAWVGVVAGQLVAMNSLISFATGRNDKWLFIIMSLIIVGYTLFGGQSSVVKTDKIQFIVIVIGVVLCCMYLYLVRGGDTASVADNIDFINQYYRPMNLLNQLFVIGGVYFLGPDIISRNFISKDESIAKKSALIAGIGLFTFSIVITLIGMWARYNITPEELGDSKTLMYVVSILPKTVSIPLIFGLLSAILSSTDTCLINASSIFVKDILRKESVVGIRIAVAAIGIMATALAVLGRGDIMSLLTGAYSIYTPGIIFPLLIAILCHKKKEIRQPIWVAAVVLGGLFGIIGTYFAPLLEKLSLPAPVMSNLSLIGMGLSLLVALISVKWNSNK